MTYDLVPKVYEIDYSFIVKNYLDPSLWEKEWTLYIYKDLVFSLRLNSINCKDSSIYFDVSIRNDSNGYSAYELISHNVKNSNINVLKKQINGKIFELMKRYERHLIKKSDGYRRLCELYADEDDNLREIAESFLDSNCVTNEVIRDVYIEDFISNNRKRWSAESIYEDAHIFLTIPDYFLVFTKIIKDETRYNMCYDKIAKDLDVARIESIMTEAETIATFDEEYQSEMELRLEAI